MIGALLLAATAGSAAPHNGPPVFLEFFIEPEVVRLTITGEQQTLGPWLEVEGLHEPPLEEALRQRLAEALLARWSELGAVEVDGALSTPRLAGVRAMPAVIDVFGGELPYELKLEFPLDAPARAVGVTWRVFPPGKRGGVPNVPTHWTTPDGSFQYQLLYENEPQYVWHAPRPGDQPRLLPTDVAPRPRPVAAALAAALAGLLLGGALLAGGGRLRVAGLAVMLAGPGLGGWWYARAGGTPTPEAALEVFENLHRNVYRAFEGTSSGQVYDLLAASVDAELLDGLYAQFYDDLILREEGGAICQVEDVEVLERAFDEELTASLDGAGFGVRWDWRVHGQVVHFGHAHQRKVRYAARYTVLDGAPGGGPGWRIAGMEVLESEREALPSEEEGLGTAGR